jgi:peptide/nickel transport system permease protein
VRTTALLRRIGAALVLLWLVVTITFILVRLAPGDPTQLLVPPTASVQDAARLRAELGLDRPLAIQYARWMSGVLLGNLGESFTIRQPVGRVLRGAMPVSLFLGGSALLLTFIIGIPLGIVQAARRGRALDHALTFATTLVYAAPSYWLALALIAVFTYGAATWGLPMAIRLPAFGMQSPGSELHGARKALDLLRHAILPLTILAAIGAAGIARYARTSVVDLLHQEWVRTARAKGVPPRRLYLRHVLANILPTMVVLFALSLPGVVAGSIFVESVFAWPGMGRLMVTAIGARDYPLILGATLWYAALVIFANLAADLSLPLLDPRRAV